MKMYFGGTPLKSMNIRHFEMNTNDCTAVPSDLQAGVTCVSKGQKITGTGKCFAFASYGRMPTNLIMPIPTVINVIGVASVDYPIKQEIGYSNMVDANFSGTTTIAKAMISGVEYPISVVVENNTIKLICDQTINLEVFYGKDEHV